MLEVFLAVAMSRTFGKAADMLNVTPSSVSRELKNLESEVGMLLVDRQKGVKSIRLTPAGEALLPLVLKWQEARKEIADSYSGQSAAFLAIVGSEVANNNLLPQLFTNLLQHDPPVHLRINTDPTDMAYEKIETREFDVAFVVHREPSRYVSITPIYEDVMMVARLEAEEGVLPRALHPEELDPSEELYIEWSPEFRLWHNTMWDPMASIPIQLLSPHLVPRLMRRPGQWAILPSCVEPHLQNSGKHVVWHTLAGAAPMLTFYKLTHRYPKLSALKGLEILDDVLRKMELGKP
jgi:Transcriptional regulator